jgi:type VI secretion system secreted protein VgrG
MLVGNLQFTPAQAAYSEITLGSAGSYVLLAGSAITNGASTTFAGDGSRISGISPTLAAAGIGASLLASGSTQFDDAGETATAAQLDLLKTFNFVDSLTVTNPQAVISNETLTAGLYGTESSVALAISGTVTLDGAGDNRSIFIIRTGSALDFAAATTIILINGAQASNIYWVAGSALTMGASSKAFGNFLARSAMTVGANSVVTGAFLTQGAITLGDSVSATHELRIAYVAPVTATPAPTDTSTATSTPTPVPPVVIAPVPAPEPAPVVIYTPEPVIIFPSPTPEPIVTITPEPVVIATPDPAPSIEISSAPIPIATTSAEPSSPPTPTIAPIVVFPQPSLLPNVPLISPTPTSSPSEPSTPIVTNVAIQERSFITRADYPLYDPLKHPRNTTNTAIAAFAVLSVITSGATKSQGYLAQVGRGGKLAAAIALGRGDRRRARKSKVSGKSINFFTSLATAFFSISPLASRTISDASYLRAGLGSFSLITYPLGLILGTLAVKSVHFQGLPPSIAFLVVMMALGVLDAMAGFLAGIIFALLVAANGNIGDLKTALTLAGILLLSYSPGILAGVFRPLRRVVNDSRTRWERTADYILAAILSGWVVKQIALGFNGLSGLQLPIVEHANELGLIAGTLVVLRFMSEDFIAHTFPSRVNDLEPEYHERNIAQRITSSAMQVLVFALVAQPFIGWRPQLWIGVAIFTTPLIIALGSTHLPKSRLIQRWLPMGVTEILVMSGVGFLLSAALKNHSYTSAQYVLIAFVILSIPGFIFDIIRLFAGGYESTWRESEPGFFTYRVMGIFALAALVFLVTKGLLV